MVAPVRWCADRMSDTGTMPTQRPIILIPARFSPSAPVLRSRAEVTSRNLIDIVWAAGGDPHVIHPYAPGGVADDEEVAQRLALADGVLLPGGGDIAAHWSGQDNHPTMYDIDEEQDAFDLAIARIALAHGIPLLAVCRGLQVVNVSRGGTLIQDMDSTFGEGHHHRRHLHATTIEPASALASLVGTGVESYCHHHQCLDRLGEGMRVVARSAEGIVEGVEIPDATGWFLGVQWHPEDTWATDEQQVAVLRAFIAAARVGPVGH
jgi:putative glutamine amidotransferase